MLGAKNNFENSPSVDSRVGPIDSTFSLIFPFPDNREGHTRVSTGPGWKSGCRTPTRARESGNEGADGRAAYPAEFVVEAGRKEPPEEAEDEDGRKEEGATDTERTPPPGQRAGDA